MKYLSDTEILNWNRRLEKSDYAVYPLSNVRSGHPDIIFRQKINNGYSPTGEQLVETIDPFIRYDFTFSIASNRKETFFDLFEKLSKESFGTKSIYRDQKSEKIMDITFNDNVIDLFAYIKQKFLRIYTWFLKKNILDSHITLLVSQVL